MGMKKKVAIFGGGVAGLSAAQELLDGVRANDFEVTLYECAPVLGGKAVSNRAAGMPAGRQPYPGEHGFRFFPTFYRHVIDTMHRIPSASRSPDRPFVDLHLQSTPSRMLARYGKAPILMPTAPNLFDPTSMFRFFRDAFTADTGLTDGDIIHFVSKLFQLATSCKARRIAEYEPQSWWTFIEADTRSDAFQHYFAIGLTHSLVAADPHEINAKTGGDVLVRLLIDSAIPEIKAAADRVLDGPTSDVWIDPWFAYLEGKPGFAITRGTLLSFDLGASADTVATAQVRLADGSIDHVETDYYVMALPVEAAAVVLTASPSVLTASPGLANVAAQLKNDVRSMSGLQFYLSKPLQNLPSDLGHALYIDTTWALTSIGQSAFWRPPFDNLAQWGNGDVKAVLSTIVADWNSAFPEGRGVCANACQLDDLRDRTLQQLTDSLNGDGVIRLDPATVIAWNLDAAVTPSTGPGNLATNSKMLLINKPGKWQFRPEASPQGLCNLMLASDYVRTTTDLATMEGANEAARRAVNAILDDAGSAAPRCELFELYYPDVLLAHLPWVDLDQAAFDAGLAWSIPAKLDVLGAKWINPF